MKMSNMTVGPGLQVGFQEVLLSSCSEVAQHRYVGVKQSLSCHKFLTTGRKVDLVKTSVSGP